MRSVKIVLLMLVAIAVLSLTAAPAQAWFPGQRIFQGARHVARGAVNVAGSFVENRVEGVERRVGRRQNRRADGRGLGRLGVGYRAGAACNGSACAACK